MERTKEDGQGELLSLLEKARDGDRDAFKTIVSLYQKKVFLLAYSFLGNREDALDIVQETFMRLYQKLGLFQTEGNFQAWLFQMTRNMAIDFYRRNYHHRRQKEASLTIDQTDVSAPAEDSQDSRADLRRLFSHCLEKLDSRQKMVLVMKHYNGLRYAEIARALDISVGTVKSLHFKAVRNMRKLLGPQLGMK